MFFVADICLSGCNIPLFFMWVVLNSIFFLTFATNFRKIN